MAHIESPINKLGNSFFLLEFGYDTLTKTHSHEFHTLISFFTEKAMRNPIFQKCQRELIDDYQEVLTDILMKYVICETERSFVKDVAGFVSVVLEGLSSHRVLFEDRQRMEAVWLLTVESIISWLNEERKN